MGEAKKVSSFLVCFFFKCVSHVLKIEKQDELNLEKYTGPRKAGKEIVKVANFSMCFLGEGCLKNVGPHLAATHLALRVAQRDVLTRKRNTEKA